MRDRTENRGHRRKRRLAAGLGIALVVLAAAGTAAVYLRQRSAPKVSPEELLLEYMACIEEKNYGDMYQMIDPAASGNITEEKFVERNSNIYEGIGISSLQVEIEEDGEGGMNDAEDGMTAVDYVSRFDTVAGEISFSNTAFFVRGKNGYRLTWKDSLIFPELGAADKVRVSSTKAQRGRILDRNGLMMAGEGTAVSVGLVPMYMEEDTIRRTASMLNISEEAIQEKLEASWVREDTFVPVKTIQKVGELELMAVNVEESLAEEYRKQQELLEIPGVQFQDIEVRQYPYQEAAAHLIGYVQNVTAEDLEQHEGEGYASDSVIGRSGMEALYEQQLRGRDGYKIWIEDQTGREKRVLASRLVEHGEDVRLTIDAELQKILYEEFKEDEGCSVAMNPYTGEVLALVSTPSYDNNLFVLGMSQGQWELLNGDEGQPMLNRFRQTWCPGSTLKPIIAAVGLDCGAIDPSEDFGSEGLRWQKDTTWGDYFVTTLHSSEPSVLENAMMCSDNIYFAKAALRIGADELTQSLRKLGFGSELPFEIVMAVSQYSNTEAIDSEIQLADSGYGQGQILVNPLHLAALYTMFCNEGDVIQPQLLYREMAKPQVWIAQAFPEQVISQVNRGLDLVINQPEGTGYAAHRDDIWLMGKTGTAEIKASQEDDSGTELGWFAVFTADRETEKPLLLVSMVEDVKERGGSGYVVDKDVRVLEWYL